MNKRKKIRSSHIRFHENNDEEEIIHEGAQKYKIEVFIVVIDTLISNLKKRKDR
ncbi:hypothetical protein A3Q56_08744 [Intoshia linei]|uniref:Uncharacterized protein n=1 Tax=Intoshia linei TaxID=1819745 RepID=A0A177ANE1_9BILA|nr:hypothetical protein A3Q56_08744 [Intoshia linei]